MVAGAIVYFGLLKLLKVDELDYIWAAVRRRLSRRRGAAGQDEAESALPVDMGGGME
jgi:hypothetical protein